MGDVGKEALNGRGKERGGRSTGGRREDEVPPPASPAAPPGGRADLRRRLAVGLGLAIGVYLLLAFYGDLQKLPGELGSFPWHTLPLVLGLTLLNYGGRWIKWHWYLGLVGSPLRWYDSGRIFGAGMTMVMTPGKVGEFLKSYMVKQVAGTPMAVTSPIIVAERLTDGLALVVLASVGLWSFPDPRLRAAAMAVVAGLVAIVVIVQSRPLATRLLHLAERLPLIRRFAHSFESFYESSYTLLKPRNLLPAVAIGVLSWTAEGLAYYVVLRGFGTPGGWENVLHAVFIFSSSTIAGAVVATPGGLGATEASLVALSQRLLALGRTPATAAALVVRFATLWFGVGIGLACLLRWPDLLAGAPAAAEETEARALGAGPEHRGAGAHGRDG